MKNIHFLNLQPEPYALIKANQKTIEMRLNDPKRQAIKVGDFIIFTNDVTRETLKCKVLKLTNYQNFKELYQESDLVGLGYKLGQTANAQDMEKYYTTKQINEFGALAIHVMLLDD